MQLRCKEGKQDCRRGRGFGGFLSFFEGGWQWSRANKVEMISHLWLLFNWLQPGEWPWIVVFSFSSESYDGSYGSDGSDGSNVRAISFKSNSTFTPSHLNCCPILVLNKIYSNFISDLRLGAAAELWLLIVGYSTNTNTNDIQYWHCYGHQPPSPKHEYDNMILYQVVTAAHCVAGVSADLTSVNTQYSNVAAIFIQVFFPQVWRFLSDIVP